MKLAILNAKNQRVEVVNVDNNVNREQAAILVESWGYGKGTPWMYFEEEAPICYMKEESGKLKEIYTDLDSGFSVSAALKNVKSRENEDFIQKLKESGLYKIGSVIKVEGKDLGGCYEQPPIIAAYVQDNIENIQVTEILIDEYENILFFFEHDYGVEDKEDPIGLDDILEGHLQYLTDFLF